MAHTHNRSVGSYNIFSFVKSQIPILEVVQEYVNLKRSGSYWKGYSPFRAERTPSFTVSPEKGIYYCFSTNTGGDVINFIAEMENCSQYEAAQHLIERYHLQPPEEVSATPHDTKKQYHVACSLFATWCHKQLFNNDTAWNYLTQRDIPKTAIERFQLGVCPKRSALYRSLIPHAQKHGISRDQLIETGILRQGSYGLYSPFEQRIIFPISDHIGHICGFGGRIFHTEDHRPKYYNSPEHTYFHKGNILYHLDQAKSAMQQHGYAYLVEGYTDCVAMVGAGYNNTVATLGTACTRHHLELLARYAHRVCILFDGDSAGYNALLKLTHQCWDIDLEVSVIPLHPGEDPASLAIDGKIHDKVNETYDIFQFYIFHMGASFLQKPLQQRIFSVRNVIKTVGGVQDTLKRHLLMQQAAQTFDIPLSHIQKEVSKPSYRLQERHDARPPRAFLEKCLIYAALYETPPLSEDELPLLYYLLPDALSQLFEALMNYRYTCQTFRFDAFFAILDNRQQKIVSKIIAECEQHLHTISWKSLLPKFYQKKWKEAIKRVKSCAQNGDGDNDAYHQALRDVYALKYYIVRRGVYGKQKRTNGAEEHTKSSGRQ